MNNAAEAKTLAAIHHGGVYTDAQRDRLELILDAEGESIAHSHIEAVENMVATGGHTLSDLVGTLACGYDSAVEVCGEFGIDIKNLFVLEVIMTAFDFTANEWALKTYGVAQWDNIDR
tara:strand:+ start:6364 stop:6717 length:354 start_codon:yes stop_codon:yes gene_type:complete